MSPKSPAAKLPQTLAVLLVCVTTVATSWPLGTFAATEVAHPIGQRPVKPSEAGYSTESIVESGERGGKLDPVGTNFSYTYEREMGDAMEAWNGHNWGDGAQKLRAIYESHPESPWAGEAELHVACFLKYNGQYDAAEERFLSILAKYPENLAMRRKVLRFLPHVYYTTGRFAAARDTMRLLGKLQMTWQEQQFYENWMRTIHAALSERAEKRDCGPVALALARVALERAGQGRDLNNLTLDSVRAANPWVNAPPSHAEGYSVAELAKLGSGVAKRIDYDSLMHASSGNPILAYLQGPADARAYSAMQLTGVAAADDRIGHFAAVIAATDWYVDVLDPNQGQTRWRKADFVYHWRGVVIELPGQAALGGTPIKEETTISMRGGCCGSPPPDPPKGCNSQANGGGGGKNGAPFPVGGTGGTGGGCGSCGASGGGPPAGGSPRYSFGLPAADFALYDTPIWYPNVKGPTLGLHLMHNRVETERIAEYTNANFHPFGPKWNFNLASYMLETPATNAQIILPSGALEEYIRTGGAYVPLDVRNRNKLAITNGFAMLTIDASGDAYSFSTNTAELYLVRHEDRHGNTMTFQYDAYARLTNVIDAVGRYLSFRYDSLGRVTSVVDAVSRSASFTYGNDGDLQMITDMGGYTTTLGYQGQHWITNIVYPNGYEWAIHSTNGTGMGPPFNDTNQYADVGNPAFRITVTNPMGQTNEYTHYAFWAGGPVSVRDFAGNTWGYSIYPWWSERDTISHDLMRFTHKWWLLGNPYTIEADYHENRTYDSKRNVYSRYVHSTPHAMENYAAPAGYDSELFYYYAYDSNQWLIAQYSRTNGILHGWKSNHYDTAGNLIRQYDEQGTVTAFGRDIYGDITAITDALGQVTIFTNTAGNVASVTDPRGNSLIRSFTSNGLLASVTDAGGGTSHLKYDQVGRLTNREDAAGWSVGYSYDNLDRLIRLSYADTTYEEYVYSCCGLDSIRDRLGRLTTYVHDSLGQVTAVTNAAGQAVHFGYESGGAVTSLVSYVQGVPRARQYHYTHEYGQTWLTQRVSALSKIDTFRYGVRGWLSERVDAMGRTNDYAYDALGRLLRVNHGSATQGVSFTYDKVGHLIWQGNATSTNRYSYDALGRVTNVLSELAVAGFSNVSFVLNKTYDANGNEVKCTLAGLRGFTNVISSDYDYDAVNHLMRASNQFACVAYEYDVAGRQVSKAYGNGDITRCTYDVESYLTSLVTTSSYGIVQSAFYCRDPMGQMTSVTNETGSWSYAYDALGQLTSETWNAASALVWTYDENGNRQSQGGLGGTSIYTYDADDELVSIIASTAAPIEVHGQVDAGPHSNKWYQSWAESRGIRGWVSPSNGSISLAGVPVSAGTNMLLVRVTDVSGNMGSQTVMFAKSAIPSTQAFAYDDNGNLTNWISSETTNSYTYDPENQLVRAARNGATMLECWYDSAGRRIAKREIVNGMTNSVQYVYDARSIVAVLNEQGRLIEYYTRGRGIARDIGSIIAETKFTDDAPVLSYYYHCNKRGDVTTIRQGATNTVATYEFGPFGEQRSCCATYRSRFMFSSKEYDAGAELYYYGYRFYSPQFGRWITRDPSGAGELAPYQFCGNAPTHHVDPLGLKDCCWEEARLAAEAEEQCLARVQKVYDEKLAAIDRMVKSELANNARAHDRAMTTIRAVQAYCNARCYGAYDPDGYWLRACLFGCDSIAGDATARAFTAYTLANVATILAGSDARSLADSIYDSDSDDCRAANHCR